MMWTPRPRLLGMLIALPSVPLTAFGVHWSLAPGARPAAISSEPALVEVPEPLAVWLDASASTPASTVAVVETDSVSVEAVPVVIDEGLRVVAPGEGGKATRVGVFRDGVQMGWVEAAPGLLASLSIDRVQQMAEREAVIAHDNDVQSRRFAEAARMAEQNADRRTSERQHLGRDSSPLAQIIRRTSTLMNRGPRFERPRFVQQIQRERAQVRRANERRSECRDHDGNCSHR